MQRLHEGSLIRLRLKTFAAVTFGLYLLLNAFLTHCLVQPHNGHLQGQANSPLASICMWVHKTVSPHAPSAILILPVVVASLFILTPLLPRSSQFQIIKRTGRSPPQLCLA
ncbi:hypothetical protein CLG94_03730 [Candidatus Methylomirabilis limnetica]|uniref:Uncharacterized protein n=1 Tax=Candidatus Methylomirabilis limnetica TaxID=2033718 RepID=A0A2T4TZE9_9BACT|nr:hypothetical protein CLG94_03730 [Candidatus Methylomirabilis limnetica]